MKILRTLLPLAIPGGCDPSPPPDDPQVLCNDTTVREIRLMPGESFGPFDASGRHIVIASMSRHSLEDRCQSPLTHAI